MSINQGDKLIVPDTMMEKLSAQVMASEKRAEAARARAEEFPEERVTWGGVPATQEAASQMQFSDHEEEEEEDDEEEPEQDDNPVEVWDNGVNAWVHQNRPKVAVKRPRGYVLPEEEVDEEILENAREYKRGFAKSLICEEEVGDRGPDLQAYFAQWPGMSTFSQIAMCRTFANYKAQEMRALKPKTEKKPRIINYGKGH